MPLLVLVSIFSVLAGISQGVCGFGAGIILMVLLPHFYPISQSAAITGIISLVIIVFMLIRYRRHIRIEKVILPLILYAAVSSSAIYIAPHVDEALLKRLFGIFLVLITLYHFLLAKKSSAEKWPLAVSILAIAFSGLCSGLFSVGGPLMVLYFLAHTGSKEEFLGTTECLFFINLLLATCLRVKNGILLPAHIAPILAGVVGVGVGVAAANKIVDRVNGEKLKNIVYIGVGISGMLNMLGL